MSMRSTAAAATTSSPAWIGDAWRAIPPGHFALAALFGTAWGLANALGFSLAHGAQDVLKTSAYFVYESLLPMFLLVPAIALADARAGAEAKPLLPYLVAGIFAAIAGEAIFAATSPLLGLRDCACSMDEWTRGGRSANMLPDSLLICGFVAVGYRYRRRTVQRIAHLHAARLLRAQLTRQTLESRLQAMQACIEPEFLFDTLAEVERLHATDPQTAVRLLDELIVYLRAALPHLRETTSIVAKECELAYAYLSIQKLRHGDALTFAFEVSAEAHDANLPPMVLLPLLDHAIRSGFDPKTAVEALRITVARVGERLRVVLRARGAAFRPGGQSNEAVAGVRERLQMLYGEAAQVELAADAQRTSTLSLEIPYEPIARSQGRVAERTARRYFQ